MAKYDVYAGLGGGFGGAEYKETREFATPEEADDYAYELACQEYEMYEGMHGLPDMGDIEEDPEYFGLTEDASDEELEEAYVSAREGWIDYWAELVEEYSVYMRSLSEL